MSKKKNANAKTAKPETFPRIAADPDLVPLSEMDKEKKAAGKTKGGKKTKAAKAKKPKADKPKKEKRVSCLDAAAIVLKAKGEPMQAKSMIEAMAEKNLWKSDAPTPAATLYAAIIREIGKKGKDSRFKKTDRGHFGLNA